MQETLNKMVASVRHGIISPEDASRTIHECAAMLRLELAEKISEALKDGTLEMLKSVKVSVNEWLLLNDLMPSESGDKVEGEPIPPSEEKPSQGTPKPDTSEDSVNNNLSFDIISYNLTKEVGDGFDYFEAGTNQYLFPIIISFKDNLELEGFSLALELDLKTKIYPDPDASLAFASQEGITSFFDANATNSNEPLALVFIFPIEGLESESTILKLFNSEDLIGQKNIEITK